MVQIVNATVAGGGFRHYSGLLPVMRASGDASHASVRLFHLAPTNAAAFFKGDIATYADSTHGVQGAGDNPANIAAPSSSVIVGNGGGSGLGNSSIAPNAARWAPADTTAVIVGVVVGFGPITLYMAKNGFQYVPASTEAWLSVDTDPDLEMYATMPTVPGTAMTAILGEGIDVKANAGQQNTKFGISGLSLDPATPATTSTLPLRIVSSGEMIGNDPTAAGYVAKVQFNKTRHYRGNAGFVAD
jgi:hypothetical protein